MFTLGGDGVGQWTEHNEEFVDISSLCKAIIDIPVWLISTVCVSVPYWFSTNSVMLVQLCDTGSVYCTLSLIGTSGTILSDTLLQILLRTILKLTSPIKHWTSFSYKKVYKHSLLWKECLIRYTFSDISSDELPVYDTLSVPPTGASVVVKYYEV